MGQGEFDEFDDDEHDDSVSTHELDAVGQG